MNIKKINWTEDNGEYFSDVYFNQFRFRIYYSSLINGEKLIKLEAINKESYIPYSNLFVFYKSFSLKSFTTLDIMEMAYNKLCEVAEDMQEKIDELLEEK